MAAALRDEVREQDVVAIDVNPAEVERAVRGIDALAVAHDRVEGAGPATTFAVRYPAPWASVTQSSVPPVSDAMYASTCLGTTLSPKPSGASA